MNHDEQLYFEDFQPGDIYPGQTKTLGESEFGLFSELTGDSHPIHYDDTYAKATHFGGRVCHGLLLTSITALGATPLSRRLLDSMVAFVEQDTRFTRPVLIGETVRTELEVESVCETRSGGRGIVRFNVRVVDTMGQGVLTGHQSYLLKKKK